MRRYQHGRWGVERGGRPPRSRQESIALRYQRSKTPSTPHSRQQQQTDKRHNIKDHTPEQLDHIGTSHLETAAAPLADSDSRGDDTSVELDIELGGLRTRSIRLRNLKEVHGRLDRRDGNWTGLQVLGLLVKLPLTKVDALSKRCRGHTGARSWKQSQYDRRG